MSDYAIRVTGLSKQYRLGGSAPYHRFSELLTYLAAAPLRAVRRLGAPASASSPDRIWALHGVGFDVQPGEVVGVIGRNGAGKSTLLKILSRITEPTAGEVRLRGRVGSLLEIGTGFHPELTGRENIFLNGAILGMTRSEIRGKFDDIVAFSEIERFLDTPVKRYSSGMYMRLAFAVAAHMEPEILLVDEVLAVGDAAFQKKCLGKMSDVAIAGRTILFVSHNMSAVRQLCSRVIWIHNGVIAQTGPAEQVIAAYLDSGQPRTALAELDDTLARIPPDPAVQLRSVRPMQNGQATTLLVDGEPSAVEFEYDIRESVTGFHLYIQLLDADQEVIFESIDNGDAETPPTLTPGRYRSRVEIPADFLRPGSYTLRIQCAIYRLRTMLPKPIDIPIEVHHTGRVNRAYPDHLGPGRIAPLLKWSIERYDLST